jgi:predicted O-linked N-acetylglucosamine transferase (SPINDLY family)
MPFATSGASANWRALTRLCSRSTRITTTALGFQLHAQLQVCDLAAYPDLTSRIAAGVALGEKRTVPFAFLIHCDNAAAQLDCARIYAQDKYPASSAPLWLAKPTGIARSAIAYLSADFHTHATAFLMARVV